MTPTTPSTRACLITLAELSDTGAVYADLQRHYTQWLDDNEQVRVPAMEAALDRLSALGHLAHDLADNLRSGGGVPPTPTVARKPATARAAPAPQAFYGFPTPAQRAPHAPRVRATAPATPATPAAPRTGQRKGREKGITPEGYVSSAEFIIALDMCLSTFHEQRKLRNGHIPAPDIGGGCGSTAYWRIAVVEQEVANRLAARQALVAARHEAKGGA